MIPKVVHFCFPEIIDVNLPKCRDSPRTSNVEILHISKHFDFPQHIQIFLRESLESLLDFKSVDIQSIEPTFVCIWVLHSDPLRYLMIRIHDQLQECWQRTFLKTVVLQTPNSSQSRETGNHSWDERTSKQGNEHDFLGSESRVTFVFNHYYRFFASTSDC